MEVERTSKISGIVRPVLRTVFLMCIFVYYITVFCGLEDEVLEVFQALGRVFDGPLWQLEIDVQLVQVRVAIHVAIHVL
jgi:hypothetical protein